MMNPADNLWHLFEQSGCILYYLLYKMFITQLIAGNRTSNLLEALQGGHIVDWKYGQEGKQVNSLGSSGLK